MLSPYFLKNKTMKNILILCINALIALNINAQNGVFIYPVKYLNSKDILIKTPFSSEQYYLALEEDSSIRSLEEGNVLIENLSEGETLTILIKSIENDSILTKIIFDEKQTEMLQLDLPIYKVLSQWAIEENQNQSLSDLLISMQNKNNILDEEILYFVQTYLDGIPQFNRDIVLSKNIKNAFTEFKHSKKMISGCQCIQLNHDAEITPLKPNSGNYLNGYNYLDASGQFSQGINNTTYFNSSSPKWHRWYTNEKGPAHDNFLRQYDQGGRFSYEWSSFSHDNSGGYSPSLNNASILFNFFCTEIGEELPDDCDCTKKLTILYRYDTKFSVIASKLKPLSKVHSIAQEISTISYASSSGKIELLDAGMAKYETECNGSFNFDFIKNWFDLGEAVLGLIIDVQDSTNGSIPQDISSNLGDIVNTLEAIATTSPIEVSGDCTPKYGEENLMAGGKIIEMKANDPVVITLSSFTFLGTYGKRKWDNYARTGSDFWLQGFVDAGSLEGSNHCCSDKVTRFVQASVNGPKSETDLINWIESWVKLYAPWDKFMQVGDFPLIDHRSNRGYFIHNDPERNCFPTSPEIPDFTDAEGLKVLKEPIEAKETETITSEDLLSHSNPHSALLVNIYPNPGHDFVNLNVANCKNSHLAISIYNSLGQEIVEIINERVQQDKISIQWLDEHNQMDSGVYFVVIKQDGRIVHSSPLEINK